MELANVVLTGAHRPDAMTRTYPRLSSRIRRVNHVAIESERSPVAASDFGLDAARRAADAVFDLEDPASYVGPEPSDWEAACAAVVQLHAASGGSVKAALKRAGQGAESLSSDRL